MTRLTAVMEITVIQISRCCMRLSMVPFPYDNRRTGEDVSFRRFTILKVFHFSRFSARFEVIYLKLKFKFETESSNATVTRIRD